jgi:hypothetical protein
LEFYGIDGMMGKLIKSYLTDRHQRTLINNNSLVGVSDWQKLKQGVTWAIDFFNIHQR